jgi:hypothetical protein
MSKDPSPRADALRAQREARYGHLQATADPVADKAERLVALRKAAEQKKRPYAGKLSNGIGPKIPTGKNPGRKRMTKHDRKAAR